MRGYYLLASIYAFVFSFVSIDKPSYEYIFITIISGYIQFQLHIRQNTCKPAGGKMPKLEYLWSYILDPVVFPIFGLRQMNSGLIQCVHFKYLQLANVESVHH